MTYRAIAELEAEAQRHGLPADLRFRRKVTVEDPPRGKPGLGNWYARRGETGTEEACIGGDLEAAKRYLRSEYSRRLRMLPRAACQPQRGAYVE